MFFWPILSNSLFGKLVGRVPIATNSGVPSSSTPYTMFGATVSLVTTSAEDLRLFRVERVRLLSEKGHFFLAITYRVSVETSNKPLLDLVSGPKRLILAIRNVILRVV